MPKMDGSGPNGQGTGTGRKLGKCTNFGANKKNSTEQNTIENNNIDNRSIRNTSCRGQGGQGMRHRKNNH